jgi:hypothetical protein
VLVLAVLWLPLGLFAMLEPRYASCLQPLVLLAAGATGARALERLSARRAPRAAAVALAVVATAAPTAWYAATGGARDVEAPIVAALRREARPGDGVLYDVGSRDAFRRRPADLPAAPRSLVGSADGAARLDALGVRWVVRASHGGSPSPAPLYAPEFLARLEEVEASTARGLFQAPVTLTLYRLRR